MYNTVLLLHSWLRWVVVLSGLFAVARAASGLRGSRPFAAADRRAGLVFLISVDLQWLLGLLLYLGLSPLVQSARQMGGAMMKHRVFRFWGVEHISLMLVAWVLTHVVWVLTKRAPAGPARFRRMAYGFGAALVLMLAAIPWPFLPQIGRPLLHLP